MEGVLRTTVVLTLLTLTACFDWRSSLPESQILYACEGGDVNFPWSYSLQTSPMERVNCIEWFFQNQHTVDMIGVHTHGSFVPTSLYTGRVRFLDNGGISLANVTKADAGNYSVETEVVSEGSAFSSRRHVMLVVVDHLQTKDGDLRLIHSPSAVREPDTLGWKYQLLFGPLTYLVPPSFLVECTTPSGLVCRDNEYKEGFFTFRLPNPVVTGKYTCQITPDTAEKACLHDNSTYRELRSVLVDGVQARLTLLEASAPKPLAFYARTLENKSYDNLTYDDVLTNVGGGFREETGKFTAPVSGYYSFAFLGHFSVSDGCKHMSFELDGHTVRQVSKTCGDQAPYEVTLSVALYLQRGQSMWAQYSYRNQDRIRSSHSVWGMYSEDNYDSNIKINNAVFRGFLMSADPFDV